MKIYDMRNEPDDDDEDSGDVSSIAISESPYPYGICLRLGDDELAKLGYDEPEAGQTVKIEAVGIVTRYTEEQEPGDKEPDCRVEIQITKLGVEPDVKPQEAAESSAARYR